MDLFSLDDLIPRLGIDPSDEHLEELFSVFEDQFINNAYEIDGCQIRIDMRYSQEEEFSDYPHTFVKLITRGKKGKRVFDRKRANKLHWIKHILDSRETEDVICFQFKEGNGKIRDYFWFQEGDYIVVMEKITPHYVIVSGFHIDDDYNRNYYRRKYENRE